ncbi:trigger factor [Verrucomicrobiota bacterium]
MNVQDAGPCRKVLLVDAPAEAVAEVYEKVVEAYAKAAKIPGFRKGKAPSNVVEKRYRDGIIEDAKERLVPLLYHEALEKEGIKPVAVVDVKDVKLAREDGMSFQVTFDVAPEFKVPKYKRIVLKREKVEVDDKEADDAFTRLVDNFATFGAVEGEPAAEGDLVKIDYKGVSEGRSVGEFASDCAGLGEGKDFLAMVGEPEFLPGVAAHLKGMSPGDEKEIEVNFPGDFRVPAVAGKSAVYTVKVNEVRRKALPEIDDEFLKRFEVKSEEELRAKIRSDMGEAAEDREKDRLKGEISSFLLGKVNFDLPESIVEHEKNMAVRSIVSRSAMGGASREQIEAQKDDIVDAATRSSTERVKLSYILGRIADAEDIQVEDSEVDNRIEALAPRYQTTPERLRSELKERDGLEGLRSDVRAEKTLGFLLDNAKIK